MHDKTDQHDVLLERRGTAGIIRLNRARALNSLTLDMVRTVAAALDAFAADPAVATVVVMGEGERGFCAGGDIRALHESGRTGTPLAENFWRDEFRLNHRIATYEKPYVALMDGITMGGGVGLSSHGRHRVVTERTRFAMPETGIGYFPDVGATWLLAHAPAEIGTWMGLTGLEVGPADVIHAGLADVQVASFQLPELIETLAELPRGAVSRDVDSVLKNLGTDPGRGPLRANHDVIEPIFRLNSVRAIAEALHTDGSDFADKTLHAMSTRSPTSLVLTLRLLREGKQSRSLAECLRREFGACLQILKSPDFYEGIRAAVIDKDRNPNWSPARLDEVKAETIDAFFYPADVPLSL